MDTQIRHFLAITRAHEDGDGKPTGLTTVVASTPVEDRYKDIVAGPWRLRDYRANPVVPWTHDYWIPPVGRAEHVREEDEDLMADIRWDDHESNPLGRTVAHQYREGFLSAVSVGFRPNKVTRRSEMPADHPHYGEKGLLFTDNDLLEISAVPIPANPKALAQRQFRPWFAGEQQAVELLEPGEAETAEDFIGRVLAALKDPRVAAELEGLLLAMLPAERVIPLSAVEQVFGIDS